LPSSNTTDSATNLCETCTGSAFPNCIRLPCENYNHPSSDGTSSFRHPLNNSARRWIEAKSFADADLRGRNQGARP
jgi:hypothetical protein